MKILVIFTGGTIGSCIDETGHIVTDEGKGFALLSMYEEAYREESKEVSFDTVCPYRILSENLDGSALEKLIYAVDSGLSKSKYDGIIVTHGSDSLSFAAAMLDAAFGDCSVPVILVASDFVLTDPRANGLVNFAYAVRSIAAKTEPGVYISYRNNGEHDARLFPGYAVLGASFLSADVTCIPESAEKYRDELMSREDREIVANCIRNRNLELAGSQGRIDKKSVYPGLVYPTVTASLYAVILEGYHSGTICINDNLKAFAGECAGKGIPIYVTGLNPDEAEYETVDSYRELGIIPLKPISPIAAYCRLWMRLACGVVYNPKK